MQYTERLFSPSDAAYVVVLRPTSFTRCFGSVHRRLLLHQPLLYQHRHFFQFAFEFNFLLAEGVHGSHPLASDLLHILSLPLVFQAQVTHFLNKCAGAPSDEEFALEELRVPLVGGEDAEVEKGQETVLDSDLVAQSQRQRRLDREATECHEAFLRIALEVHG